MSDTTEITIKLKSIDFVNNLGTSILRPAAEPYTVKQVGIQGIAGTSAVFNFVQASPLSTWTINHNLGFIPIVDLFSVGGAVIEADIINTSINQVIVNFNVATAGSARCI